MHLDPTVYGWLWKRGSGFKTWKKRFFVLKEKQLTYYDQCVILSSKNSLRWFEAKPKGSVIVDKVEESSKTEFGLCIHSTTGRKLFVQADSMEARQQWLKALSHHYEENHSSSNSCDQDDRDTSGTSSIDSSRSNSPRDTSSSNDSLDDRTPSQRLNCQKSGWLTKQGGTFHTWKHRFFVLKDMELSYQEHDSQNSPPLNSGRVVGVTYSSKKEFGLVIRLLSGRELYVNASSNEDRNAWFTALDTSLTRITRSRSSLR